MEKNIHGQKDTMPENSLKSFDVYIDFIKAIEPVKHRADRLDIDTLIHQISIMLDLDNFKYTIVKGIFYNPKAFEPIITDDLKCLIIPIVSFEISFAFVVNIKNYRHKIWST